MAGPDLGSTVYAKMMLLRQQQSAQRIEQANQEQAMASQAHGAVNKYLQDLEQQKVQEDIKAKTAEDKQFLEEYKAREKKSAAEKTEAGREKRSARSEEGRQQRWETDRAVKAEQEEYERTQDKARFDQRERHAKVYGSAVGSKTQSRRLAAEKYQVQQITGGLPKILEGAEKQMLKTIKGLAQSVTYRVPGAAEERKQAQQVAKQIGQLRAKEDELRRGFGGGLFDERVYRQEIESIAEQYEQLRGYIEAAPEDDTDDGDVTMDEF